MPFTAARKLSHDRLRRFRIRVRFRRAHRYARPGGGRAAHLHQGHAQPVGQELILGEDLKDLPAVGRPGSARPAGAGVRRRGSGAQLAGRLGLVHRPDRGDRLLHRGGFALLPAPGGPGRGLPRGSLQGQQHLVPCSGRAAWWDPQPVRWNSHTGRAASASRNRVTNSFAGASQCPM